MASATSSKSRQQLVSEFMRRGAELHSGYDFGSHGTVEEQAEFGRMVIEYFQESAHGGWEGFRDSFRGMSQIYHLLADLERFMQLIGSQDPTPTQAEDEKTDADIEYVDAIVQEYAALRGKTDSEDLVADRARYQMLQDAIRCAIDPDELRKSIKMVEADEDIYREQTS